MSLQDNEAGLKTLLQKYQTIDTSIQSQDWLLVLFLTNGVYVVYFGLTRCLISVNKKLRECACAFAVKQTQQLFIFL